MPSGPAEARAASSPRAVALHGRALHSGAPVSVALARRAGPVTFRQGAVVAPLAALSVVRADHGVAVAGPSGLRIDLIEHLLGALAGIGVGRDLEVTVCGPELPLLDGGARVLAGALLALALGGDPPALQVTRSVTYRHEGATYWLEPGDRPRVEVEVDYPGVGAQRAAWGGSPAEFLSEIAGARTFGWRRDAELLRAAGRAAHVEAGSVIVLEDDGATAAGFRPPEPGELARHKLLDVLGDLRLYGGPPAGTLRASRPGHRATHAIARRALDEGALALALERAPRDH
ncbi:MAG: UDP-3-O-acyl-N-acetylglucosamine deacetylase [Polyangiaceae bacterium]|nr:UDP-3-O-acyl-N-acetylglucosamine deacetylase [Polyangiaceae bacterium]